MPHLTDKSLFITGASRGIGKAIALRGAGGGEGGGDWEDGRAACEVAGDGVFGLSGN